MAGTWLDQLPKLDPTWKIDGQWIASREDDAQCIVGRNAARQFQLAPGGNITLSYLGRSATLGIAGVVDAGAAADNQVFVSLPVVQQLAAATEANRTGANERERHGGEHWRATRRNWRVPFPATMCVPSGR